MQPHLPGLVQLLASSSVEAGERRMAAQRRPSSPTKGDGRVGAAMVEGIAGVGWKDSSGRAWRGQLAGGSGRAWAWLMAGK
jgi:hypothetical protein